MPKVHAQQERLAGFCAGFLSTVTTKGWNANGPHEPKFVRAISVESAHVESTYSGRFVRRRVRLRRRGALLPSWCSVP
jgi:hypothetical protein